VSCLFSDYNALPFCWLKTLSFCYPRFYVKFCLLYASIRKSSFLNFRPTTLTDLSGMDFLSYIFQRVSVHCLIQYCPAVYARIPLDLLHQPTLHAHLPIYWNLWIIRVYENTLTSIIDLESSPTSWAGRWTRFATYLSFTAEGADHLICAPVRT